VAELLARLRALFRRRLNQRSLNLRYADLELDSRNRKAKRGGDNEFFPLKPGTTFFYEGAKDGIPASSEIMLRTRSSRFLV
jgi:hypothetical protein